MRSLGWGRIAGIRGVQAAGSQGCSRPRCRWPSRLLRSDHVLRRRSIRRCGRLDAGKQAAVRAVRPEILESFPAFGIREALVESSHVSPRSVLRQHAAPCIRSRLLRRSCRNPDRGSRDRSASLRTAAPRVPVAASPSLSSTNRPFRVPTAGRSAPSVQPPVSLVGAVFTKLDGPRRVNSFDEFSGEPRSREHGVSKISPDVRPAHHQAAQGDLDRQLEEQPPRADRLLLPMLGSAFEAKTRSRDAHPPEGVRSLRGRAQLRSWLYRIAPMSASTC